MRAGVLLVVMVLGASRQDEPPLEHVVPRRSSPVAQLEQARAWKGRLFGEPDESERERLRALAVRAYRAVRHYHPEARALGAEAAFRGGELLRATGRLDAAEAEFRVARSLGAGTPFRPRATLELGHVRRRRSDSRGAIEAYLDVAVDAHAAQAHRDDALYWAGRCWSDEGRVDEARRAWSVVARGNGDPLDRARAHDAIALSFVADGDLEAAAGALHACLVELSPIAYERTELGRRVRDALARLRVVPVLKAAIAERGLKDPERKAEKALTR